MKNGKIFVHPKCTKRRTKVTAAEKKQQTLFKQAVEYAKQVLVDPDKGPIYQREARLRNLSAQNLAVQDFMRPPVIRGIGLSNYSGKRGSCISVRAEDDFEFARVKVLIRDQAGHVLEEGTPVRKHRQLS
jgi:hypothetical protein